MKGGKNRFIFTFNEISDLANACTSNLTFCNKPVLLYPNLRSEEFDNSPTTKYVRLHHCNPFIPLEEYEKSFLEFGKPSAKRLTYANTQIYNGEIEITIEECKSLRVSNGDVFLQVCVAGEFFDTRYHINNVKNWDIFSVEQKTTSNECAHLQIEAPPIVNDSIIFDVDTSVIPDSTILHNARVHIFKEMAGQIIEKGSWIKTEIEDKTGTTIKIRDSFTHEEMSVINISGPKNGIYQAIKMMKNRLYKYGRRSPAYRR